ncbi:hypothetical protein BSF38_02023 [Paludisphaera borealis]|uniref:ATP-grasp domain-containing protein n=1 Tax=Paludisphaera borealis TaxID=1387353 RepID=A0A1U7CNQ4_9BACT|nr:hypothetical protein BSF38_02023 [Paludisphaera borealis]
MILTHQTMTDPTLTAERLKEYARVEGKPVLANWMGGAGVAAGEAILQGAGIPTFPYPDTAARAFDYLWHDSCDLRVLHEPPTIADDPEADPTARARAAGRAILTEVESKRLLAIYGIPTVATEVAQAEERAGRLGYPIVLKLHSDPRPSRTGPTSAECS